MYFFIFFRIRTLHTSAATLYTQKYCTLSSPRISRLDVANHDNRGHFTVCITTYQHPQTTPNMPVKAEILKVARTALHRVALALDSHIPTSKCSYCCEMKPFKAFPRHMTTSQDCYKCFRTNRGRVVCKLCLAHRVRIVRPTHDCTITG